MYGFKILCEISKGNIEILRKMLNPYTIKHTLYCFLFVCVITISLNCDVISLSETRPRPPIDCFVGCVIGWSKYGLGNPSFAMYYGLTWPVRISTILKATDRSLCTSLTAGKCLPLGLQGDRERVYSIMGCLGRWMDVGRICHTIINNIRASLET